MNDRSDFWNAKDCGQGVKEFLDVFNIGTMAGHDRKDLLIITAIPIVVFVCFWIEIFDRDDARYTIYVWLVLCFIRMGYHIWRHESKK